MRFWLIFLILIPALSLAESRPKIALVLSGGGAKGGAHIGVLKVLEENNIPIDYVIGTSIGSYVGGLYALGYDHEEISEIMLNTNFDRGYSDFIPRQALAYEDKALRDHYNLTLRLGYSDEKFKMPSGLLLGQSALQVLKTSIGPIGELASFDDLPTPYRAVATDIATSKAAVLSSGSLSQAIKASSTVPGALEPIEINGQLLVDGGIVNNMPVDVAKDLGADIVIAVDIGSSLLNQEDINSTVDVLDQLSNILTINTTNKQKALLTDKDIIIRPNIDDISTTDFSKVGEAIGLGEEAALLKVNDLQTLSLSDAEYQVYLTQKQIKRVGWESFVGRPVIDIEYNNSSNVKDVYIAKHFGIQVGDIVTKEQLEDGIEAVYALDRFDFVNAEFVDSEEGRTIVLTTEDKSWGPDYLLLGFSWQGDFSGTHMLSVDMAYLLTDFTNNGGTLNNKLSIGWETFAGIELYQPFDEHYDTFARVKLQYEEKKYIDGISQSSAPDFSDKSVSAHVGVGYHYISDGISEFGAIAQRGNFSFENVANNFGNNIGDFNYYSYGTYLSLGYDDLNSINFPTKGNKVSLDFIARKDYFEKNIEGADENNNVEVALNWRGALGIGNHTIVGIASSSMLFSDTDFSIRLTELGGFLNLSGLPKDALIGSNKVFAAAVYQYDLGKEVLGGTGLPVYLGGSVENGNVWNVDSSLSDADLITSGSVYLGTDTSFGPAVIGVGYATTFGGVIDDQATLFFSFGKNW